jgi:hemoglobin-like flavoprotein
MQDLSAEDVERVRRSFDRIWSISARAADLFYDRLFAIAPDVRILFRHDMDEQKRKFMSTLAVIVGSLDDTSKISSLTETLARHHVDYGVRPAHYAVVGDALLWSLQQGLGNDWTAPVAASWSKAYGVISAIMIAQSPNQ